MGNTGGATIYIELPQVQYSAGDRIDGRVHISCSAPVETTGIFLKLTGTEKTRWEEERSEQVDGRTVRHTDLYGGYSEFLIQELPLHPVQGTMLPGQYTIPFSLQLPRQIPSSFRMVGNGHFNRRFDCGISYRLRAAFKRPGLLKSDIKHYVELLIRPEPVSYVGEATHPGLAVAQQDVYACCLSCRSQGKISLEMATEKDHYSPGEMATVQVQVNNKTSHDFDSVNAHCKMYLRLRGRLLGTNVAWYDGDMSHFSGWGGEMSLGFGLMGGLREMQHQQNVSEVSAPAVPANSQFTGANQVCLPLHIPPMSVPSTHSSLISCEYSLKYTANICCASSPSVGVPIVVVEAPPPMTAWQQYTAPPQGWQPQTFQAIAVEIPEPSAPPPEW